MKQIILSAAAVAFTVVAASADLEIGDSIVSADIKMKNIDERMIAIDDIKGAKGTLVIFTCNKCPFVIGWQDRMVEIGNRYLTQDIGVLFINSNDPSVKGDTFEGMQKLAKEKGYRFPYVVDSTSDVARKFGAQKTPDIFLFDAAGKLVYQGAIGEGGRSPAENGEPWLQNALDALIAGKAMDKSTSKAVGCSIKFRKPE